jgi:Na+-driven multidrug efflux pump
MGARGLWWGLVAGLAGASVFQMLRLRKRLAGPIVRTVI